MQVQTSHRGVVYSGTMAQSETAGAASSLSVGELKRALKALGAPPARLAACIERPDFEALHTELSAQAKTTNGTADREAYADSVEQEALRKAAAAAGRAAGAKAAANGGGGGGGGGGNGGGGLELPSLQTCLLVAVVAYYAYGMLGGGGGGGDLDEDEGDGLAFGADESFMRGSVREVKTHDALKGLLAQHRDNTGLPVVVDFYSQGCGPCRMIAPTYKAYASEFKGRAVFAKVDVNRNYESSSACGVRAMPTFQFYVDGKLRDSFSGADSRRLRHVTEQLAQQAERQGTFVGQVVSEQALAAFYAKHDPSKVDQAGSLASQYNATTARLVKLLHKKYGEAPTTSPRPPPEEEKPAGAAGSAGAAAAAAGAAAAAAGSGRAEGGAKGKGAAAAAAADPTSVLESLSSEQLEAELSKRRAAAASKAEGEGEGEDEDEDEDDPDAKLFGPPPKSSAAAPLKVVVLGGGPAGLAAAIYAARAGLSPVVVAPSFGGQLQGKGVDVENYPGVHDATGPSLVGLMRRQAAGFEAALVSDVAVSIDLEASPFVLRLNGSDAPLHTRTLVVATGADSRWLGVPGENEHRGGGVSSCATCDGFLYRGKDVLVVGGGDSAAEEALLLARTSRSVRMVVRRGVLRASHALATRALEHPNIRVSWNTTVARFGGDGSGALTHAVCRGADGAEERLDASAAFVSIGHEPNTALLAGQLAMSAGGYLDMSASGRSARTSRAGVFAAGDVADPTYRQAITSAGSGAQAALDAERWLSEQGWND